MQNGLSVIAEPKPSRGSYGAWLGEGKPPTVRGQLEQIIDTALGQGCKDFDSFLAAMKAAGAEVKRGKHLAFKIPNGKRLSAAILSVTITPKRRLWSEFPASGLSLPRQRRR